MGFIAKYDAAGTFQWVRTLGGEDGATASAHIKQLNVAPSDNIYFAGLYGGSLAMNGVPLEEAGVTGNQDRFIGKLDANGNVAWLQGFDLGGRPYSVGGLFNISGLAVDEAHQRVYVTGADSGDPTTQITAQGIVAALNTAGATPTIAWSAKLTMKDVLTSQSSSFTRDVAVDGAGTVYVAGAFMVRPISTPVRRHCPSPAAAGQKLFCASAGYVWKLTSQGSLGWAKGFIRLDWR